MGISANRVLLAAAIFALAAGLIAPALRADDITVTGTITQSTADGTGVYNPMTGTYQAVNNPSLDNISDGDTFSLVIDLTAPITSPGGPFAISDASFTDTTPGVWASETSFDLSNALTSITIAPDASNPADDDVFLLVCLTTGSACDEGDSLSLDFMIASSDLNSASAPATLIPGLFPALDLLEDDGQTDIQGGVSTYSYFPPGGGTTNTPEPDSIVLLCCGLLAVIAIGVRRGQPSSFFPGTDQA